ncbi:adenylyl cyclase alpha, putative [Plasmodium malariae]|uniref:Adenylyl cyclase alpha, putative n=1 Tax=Plasmodium malariae TaxID=5858 RepID=A0A1C3KFY1_PLAMA|nr:adenylyl cyclase alpha, putative [Plasmodium malariae]
MQNRTNLKTIQKEKNDAEYLISLKSKRKLQNFINKKEINLREGGKQTLWDFTHLPYSELMKFINMNIPNGTKKDEEEIVLNDTIKELSTNKKKKKKEKISEV